MNKNNSEIIKNLLKIIVENSHLHIVTMVDAEVVGDDDYNNYLGKIKDVNVDYFWESESHEQIFIGEKEIKEYIGKDVKVLLCDNNDNNDEVNYKFNNLLLLKEIQRKIIIYIGV